MKSLFFQSEGEKYNKEFAFLSEKKMRFKGKDYEIEKGYKILEEEQAFGQYRGKFVIITLRDQLTKMEGEKRKDIRVVRNDKGIRYVESSFCRWVNFNRIADVNRVQQVRDFYDIAGDDDLSLMENYIKFVKDLGASHKAITIKWFGGIAMEIFYQDLSREDLEYKGNMFNPGRPSEEHKRKYVWDCLKRSCEDSGILETTVGEFRNVISIDASSFYPFILVGFKFMREDPYPYWQKLQPYGGKWDFLPIKFREHVIEFYREKEKDNKKGKFYKKCINQLTGKSISELGLEKGNRTKNNFLQPQHGFQVIEIGRERLEDFTQKLRDLGCRILERDTDGIKAQGNLKLIQELVDEENDKVVRQLLNSGLSYGDASCGIGQWKIEYVAERFKQTAPKHYSYCVNGVWTFKGDVEEALTVYAGGI